MLSQHLSYGLLQYPGISYSWWQRRASTCWHKPLPTPLSSHWFGWAVAGARTSVFSASFTAPEHKFAALLWSNVCLSNCCRFYSLTTAMCLAVKGKAVGRREGNVKAACIKSSQLQWEHTKTWSAAHKHNSVTCQSATSRMYTNNKPQALMNLNETQTHFFKCLCHLLQDASRFISQHNKNKLETTEVFLCTNKTLGRINSNRI